MRIENDIEQKAEIPDGFYKFINCDQTIYELVKTIETIFRKDNNMWDCPRRGAKN